MKSVLILFWGALVMGAPTSSLNVTKFVDPLPLPKRIPFQGKGPFTTEIRETEIKVKLHRDLPETVRWGYNGITPGPLIEIDAGSALEVHWKNELPPQHFLRAAKGTEMSPDVRTVTHLHGAVVLQPNREDRLHDNDGWPDAWITPGEEQISLYPNNQEARLLWYHDHAMMSTGRNVAAGLMGLYEIHDDYEKSLNLPEEIALILQSPGVNQDGSLYYTEDISKEFYGNAFTVNGKLWPYLTLEPRKYRFRVINAANARSFSLKLLEQPGGASGPAFYQIGTDSGFLEKTAILNDPSNSKSPRLVLAPAERADVIIDFSKSAGKTFLLQNNFIDQSEAIRIPEVMLLKVGTKLAKPDTSALPMQLRKIRRMSSADASTTRRIVFDQMTMGGRQMMVLNGKHWEDPIEETPVVGSTEEWDLVNPLIDTHPFHIHLVQFQVLDRRNFDVAHFLSTGEIKYTGTTVEPPPNEMGWKDTIRVLPQMVTRIIMRFVPFPGFYVYHCHILEHEDMDMMRPFQILPH